jgi:hypothetical protein
MELGVVNQINRARILGNFCQTHGDVFSFEGLHVRGIGFAPDLEPGGWSTELALVVVINPPKK